MKLTSRTLFILMALFCGGLMSFAFYLQYVQNLEPCPLCMTQRLCFVFTGLVALLAAIHNPTTISRQVYAAFTLLGSSLGLWTAARQVWLQHLPADKVPACGPGLDFMFEVFPFTEVLKTMLLGDGNCAEVVWTFLGFSIPEWSLLCFIGLIGASLYILVFQRKGNEQQIPDNGESTL